VRDLVSERTGRLVPVVRDLVSERTGRLVPVVRDLVSERTGRLVPVVRDLGLRAVRGHFVWQNGCFPPPAGTYWQISA
jgi:hypothetical protein